MVRSTMSVVFLLVVTAFCVTTLRATEPIEASRATLQGPATSELDFGVGLQLDRPYQPVLGTARATLFFFNLTGQDAGGAFAEAGGLGCRFDMEIRDAEGTLVWRPQMPCPLAETVAPVGPFPFPGGTLLRYPVDLPLFYRGSETDDPDGAPLPGGAYTLHAAHDYAGPVHPDGQIIGLGANPRAEVPFRIVQCSEPAGTIPFRELGRGATSGYRYGDPTFQGEDIVLRTPEAALAFWEKHVSNVTPPPNPPSVDFNEEMVIVSLLGWQSSGGGPSIEIRRVREGACHIEVEVFDDDTPGPLDVITNPWHAVAVPDSLKEAEFLHAIP